MLFFKLLARITTNIVKENKADLAPTLFTLTNKVVDEGKYPDYLKTAVIKPNNKSDDPENYLRNSSEKAINVQTF